MRHVPLRRCSAALLCLVLAAGCQTPLRKRLFLAPRMSASVLFVQPFGFRWPEPAYRSFELSQRLLAVADEKVGEQVLLFGPSEFKVYRAEDNSWAATSAISLLPGARTKPENALVLRPWAEKRVATSRREILDARGKAVGTGNVQDVTYVGHVELVHPATQTVVVEMSGEAAVDPFAEKKPEDEADPSPELSKLMQSLTAEALAELQGHLAPPARARALPAATVAFIPVAAFVYSEDGRPSLEALSSNDPLEGELLRQGRVRFANPTLDDAGAARMLKLPGGLLVTGARPGAPLKEGDVITRVGSGPALPQTLQRARFQEGVLLQVRRADGSTAEVLF